MFRKIYTQDPTLNRIQDEIVRELDYLSFLQLFASAKILRDVTINTTDTEVFHCLKQQITGYMVIKQNANAVIYQATSTPTPSPNDSIYLRASSTVVATIIIF